MLTSGLYTHKRTHMYREGEKNLGPNPGSNSVQLCEVNKVIHLLYGLSNDHTILRDVWYSIVPNKYRETGGKTEHPASSAAAVSSYVTSPEERCRSRPP